MTARRSRLLCVAGVLLACAAPINAVTAAGLDPAGLADFKRGAAMVGLSSSERLALRAEQQARVPTPGFLLGAAHAAWTNAAAQLAFDVANPTAAGPPHASQNGDLSAFLADDCREEAAAFAALTERMRTLGLSAEQLEAVSTADRVALSTRQASPPARCR